MDAVWMVGEGLAALGAALAERGVAVHVAPPDEGIAAAALALYDGRGAVIVDARTVAGRAVLAAGAALVPVVAVAGGEVALPPGVLRLAPDAPAVMAHHVVEVLRAPDDLRRHPRVPIALPLRIDSLGAAGEGSGATLHTTDLSLYGLRAAPAAPVAVGGAVEATVTLADGAQIRLIGEVVDRRADALALRCRPASDGDLLLWIHLLIGELEKSPLHGEIDPFGPLFT